MLQNILASQSCPNRLGLGVFAQRGSVWVFCWVSLAHYVRFRWPRPGSVPFFFGDRLALFPPIRLGRRIRFQRDEVALKKAQKKFTDTLSDKCFNCKIGHDQPVREKQSQRSHRRPGTTRTPWHDPVCCLCSPGVEHQQMATARFGDVTGQESQSKK